MAPVQWQRTVRMALGVVALSTLPLIAAAGFGPGGCPVIEPAHCEGAQCGDRKKRGALLVDPAAQGLAAERGDGPNRSPPPAAAGHLPGLHPPSPPPIEPLEDQQGMGG